MFSLVVFLLGLGVLVEIALIHRQQMRAIRRNPAGPARLERYPSITVVRPVKGRDVDADVNFSAALDTGYPGEVETIFIFDDVQDPGYSVACDVVQRHRELGRPGRARVEVAGLPPSGVTGKLHAMMLGEKLASNELIAFGDSDTRPDREVLRVLVEELMLTPGAGDTFAPVVVNGPPRAAGDVGYAMLINALYGPSVALTARPSGDVPFIMGQLMVFKREALAAVGGVGCARGQLVDDMAIGTCVRDAGYRNVMIDHPLYIATGGMNMATFVKLFRRWLLFSRNGLPAQFTWPMWVRGAEFWIAGIAAGLSFSTGHWLVGLLPLAGFLAYGASLLHLSRLFGGAPHPPKYWWVPFTVPVLGPACIVSIWFNKTVDWRGRAYVVDAEARLA